ncbi:DUF6088 family protein [Sphingomonas sp.]|uniref:DUF6088 family protein n=1 Tax=Sphingomonas sp. TaxID=28214 RepID=UPI003F6FB578
MKRIRGKGRGWVFTPKHFLDFGSRGAVDMAISRLAQSGSIRRVGRGLYDYPRLHDTLGALSPDPAALAGAMAAQTGDKLAPAGAAAANRLGLSTQVPARASFATTGRTRVTKAAGRSLTLRHSRAPVLDHASDTANAVVQALAQLGRKAVDADVIQRLAGRIDDADMKQLLQARPSMPGWMGDVILKIGAVHHG